MKPLIAWATMATASRSWIALQFKSPARTTTTITTFACHAAQTRSFRLPCALHVFSSQGVKQGSSLALASHVQTVPRRAVLHSRASCSRANMAPAPPTKRSLSTTRGGNKGPPSFAFSFDIDGVLMKGSVPMAGAQKTLQYLQQEGIPFIFLTNSGGKHEGDRVKDLSKLLNITVTEDCFMQSHTPFRQLVPALAEKTVLVCGTDPEKCRLVARQYGFQNVVTSGDVVKSMPAIFPFNHGIFQEYYDQLSRSLSAQAAIIDAILVFNDPRDWALDIQVIMDLLLSIKGQLGTVSSKNGDETLANHGYQMDGQPRLYFSNPDLVWSTQYHLPRYAQGAFQASLAGVFEATTGVELKRTVFGKPSSETYKYATEMLVRHQAALGHHVTSPKKAAGHAGVHRKTSNPLRNIYMIGDNPQSDIKGVHAANVDSGRLGIKWNGVLVKSGVYGEGDRIPDDAQPHVVVDDVLQAVKWTLQQEGYQSDLAGASLEEEE